MEKKRRAQFVERTVCANWISFDDERQVSALLCELGVMLEEGGEQP